MADGAFPILTVPDLAAARRFYERLGFVQAYQFPPEGEPAYVALEREGGTLGVAGASRATSDAFAYWVYVDDVDTIYAGLVAAGATSVAEPGDQPWGERLATVRDPAGNIVHLGSR